MYKFIAIFIIAFLSILILTDSTFCQQDSTVVGSDSSQAVNQQTQTADQSAQPRSAISTNPNMSVIGDFQSSYQNQFKRKFDFNFNEAELSLQSVVDPYARADFFISFAKNPGGNYDATIEEAYITTTDLPYDLQLKAGKFRMSLGRINTVHPHALPFIDVPNVLENYFGEALNSEGLSLSWLVPNPLDFYQELTFEIANSPADNPSFARTTANKYLYLAHLKNFWDVNDNSTIEAGLSGIVGPNDSSSTTSIGAFDLTYKWKPLQFNTYQSFVWQTEAFFSRAGYDGSKHMNSWGMYSFITYQIEKRWFLTGRFDYSNLPFSSSSIERAASLSLGWYATEFQKIEIEGKTTSSNFHSTINQAMLRWIFVIGSHGAHQY
jgi:hypothetical protein